MAIKKIFYNGGDKWKRRASTIINQLVDGGGGGDFIPTSEKGVTVATLDDGKLTRSQMPYFSVVDGKLCITYERG